MKNAWKKWKILVKKAMNIQVNVVLVIIYVINIIPISFVINTFNKSSNKKDSFWIKKKQQQNIKVWAKKL